MVDAVKALPREIKDIMELHVWNIKQLDGINRKNELGAKSIPSIAIAGEVVFASTIPPEEELIAAIQRRYAV